MSELHCLLAVIAVMGIILMLLIGVGIWMVMDMIASTSKVILNAIYNVEKDRDEQK